MAKIKKNLVNDRDEYTRHLGSFRGVDYSSDPSEVADYRLADCVNMYKDYHSGQGQAIETVPGFRTVTQESFGAKIYGIHVYQNGDLKKVYVHAGTKLYQLDDLNFDENTAKTVVFNSMAERQSTSFMFNNRMYLLDGENYLYVNTYTFSNGTVDYSIMNALYTAFLPTTHISLLPDGSKLEETENSGEYSQQNILSDKYKCTFVADGINNTFVMPLGAENRIVEKSKSDPKKIEVDGYSVGPYYEARLPGEESEIRVFQYGVELPWASMIGGEYTIPSYIEYEYYTGDYTLEGQNPLAAYVYPNAIISINESGVVKLVNAPPKPEDNTCRLECQENGHYVPKYYSKGCQYPVGYAGIEIVATKKVTTIKGITTSDTDNIGSIITGCTIATVFDDRVFLSGNPEYPNFVFYNGINPETGYSDPTYFGILNWFSEGVTNVPITGLLPMADTLMVLRRDTVQDGSVTFRSRVETGNDVQPVVYQGTAGLPGVGCLGACCNFLDDPIFVSKYGVEAMGQLSARYERAIEHRSSLIDGLLLNLDLSKASIAEFDGYLVLLTEGKIFLADSRQRYTHESGVMQYEWFYLDDIGVYDGQFKKYVYGDLPENLIGVEKTDEKNTKIKYILTTIDNVGTGIIDGSSMIGQGVKPRLPRGNFYYEGVEYETVCIWEGNNCYEIVIEENEHFTDGIFDPAIIIKAVDNEHLVFGTADGYLCCFNFDKRDPENDYKIPNEYYTFNGRIINCRLATKMDNCGVPHLTKNTVKKSMVVKMRTFESSAVKIKVVTNRRPEQDVERLVSSRFTFDFWNFPDLNYELGEKSIFRVREKEKKWVEKQLWFVSDEFKKPFALNNITYGYVIAGRYKD